MRASKADYRALSAIMALLRLRLETGKPKPTTAHTAAAFDMAQHFAGRDRQFKRDQFLTDCGIPASPGGQNNGQ